MNLDFDKPIFSAKRLKKILKKIEKTHKAAYQQCDNCGTLTTVLKVEDLFLCKDCYTPGKGRVNPYEAIKVIEAWKPGFHLGNAIECIERAGKKNPETELQDLKKAVWYLQRKISELEK
jgi:protein-arginine kinase activator protein McsA